MDLNEQHKAPDPKELDRKLRSALHWAGSSISGVVDWPQLERLLAVAPRALSDEARCALLLDIANGRSLTGRQWTEMMGVRPGGAPDAQGDLLTPDRVIEYVRTALAIIAESDESKLQMLRRSLERLVRYRVLRTHDEPSYLVASDQLSAVIYSLWVLLCRGFGTRLRRCRVSECGNFFFVRQAAAGAPSRTYCREDPQHIAAGERERARLRMRDIRRKHK